MSEVHAFKATKSQYERKLTGWGFKKNRKKREWVEIAERVIKRQNEGKDSEVVIDDQIIPSKKLKKEVQRYGRNLINPVSNQVIGDDGFNTNEAYMPFTADSTMSSSVAIVRSPTLPSNNPQRMKLLSSYMPKKAFRQATRARESSMLSTPLLPRGMHTPLSPLLIEDSRFLRPRHFTQWVDLRTSMKQLLIASSPLNKILKAAMMPSQYSKLMHTGRLDEGQLSTATNLNIMSAAIFLFRNSLDEINLDLGHQMFTWFRENYDATVFKYFAGRKDPSESAILEKIFRQAVCEGDSDMVRELLLTGINPNQRWRIFSSVQRIYTDPKSAIQIACERKHLRIVELLLDAGARVSEGTDPVHAPLCCLLEGNTPVDLDLVKKLMDATPVEALITYQGCLASAVRRKDLELIKLLVEANVGDNDMFHFSCLQQGCLSRFSEGNDLLPCPTHTMTFPVLKTLFITRAIHSLKLQRTDFAFMAFFSDLFDSVLHQYSPQAVKFMLDAGVRFTKIHLLFLCAIPDLLMISQLLSEAAISVCTRQGEPAMARVISNLKDTVLLEPMLAPANAKSSSEANGQHQDLAKNVTMARKITEALAELPPGIKRQCSEALVQNSLWRSLGPRDWPYYKEAFEVILQASNSDIDSSQALLLIAVKNRDAIGLHRLMDANLNCSPMAIKDLLQEVILWGDAEIFMRLINELTWIQNMESTTFDTDWNSLAKKAILRGNLLCVQELFRAGVAVDFMLSDGLGFAISERQKEIVEFLLQSGADPNAEFFSEDLLPTPLSEALISQSEDVLRLLIHYGANPNDTGALCVASELNRTVLQELLRSCRKQFLIKGGIPVLFDAILNSDLEIVQLLLGYGVDCNLLAGGRIRETCLAAAIEAGDCHILKLIIDSGVNINGVVEQDPNELPAAFPKAYTALVKAIRCQNHSAITMLLEAGAEVNPTNPPRSSILLTPLQAAAEQGDLGLVQKLLDLRANANEEPNPYGGYTALQITASKGLIGVASLLLEHGADVNAKGARKGGRTALETAAENDRIDMIRFLVNSGATIIGPDEHQFRRAKILASENGHFAVCRLLEALYEEKNGEQAPAQSFSTADASFDTSSGILDSYNVWDQPVSSTLIEDVGEADDLQSGISASLDESWALPLSPIPAFYLGGCLDE